MNKCGMQKPGNNNQTLPRVVPPMEERQKKILYPEQYKNSTGKNFEMEKVIIFLKKVEILEKIQK